MKTKAVRLYGKDDLRLEEFDLPAVNDDEILAHIISDSICMSSYKALKQGADHKRVPVDVNTNPVIIGHEFSGEIVEVGRKWQDKFKAGSKFSIQPALNYNGSLNAPGYSYKYIGGDATYIIIPNEVMEMNCLLAYSGEGYFPASLSEPMSCIVGAFHANYHTVAGSYEHRMGIVQGGNLALLAGVGPMGLGAIDYVLHCDRKPDLLVVTDISAERLKRAEQLFPVDEAKANGVRLIYLNTSGISDPASEMIQISNGKGYDDVFVFAPVKQVVEQGDKILGRDGCLNFFAGPGDPDFSANFNFYNVHYNSTHIVGTSGGNTDDMIESLELMSAGRINPAAMITHIGGLNAVINTTRHLPEIPGGKKLIYTNIDLDLVALDDLASRSTESDVFRNLASIVKKHKGLWSVEAETYLLNSFMKT